MGGGSGVSRLLVASEISSISPRAQYSSAQPGGMHACASPSQLTPYHMTPYQMSPRQLSPRQQGSEWGASSVGSPAGLTSAGGLSPRAVRLPMTPHSGTAYSHASSSLTSPRSLSPRLGPAALSATRIGRLSPLGPSCSPLTQESYDAAQAAYQLELLRAPATKHANLSRVPRPSLLRRSPAIRSQKGVEQMFYVGAQMPNSLFSRRCPQPSRLPLACVLWCTHARGLPPIVLLTLPRIACRPRHAALALTNPSTPIRMLGTHRAVS